MADTRPPFPGACLLCYGAAMDTEPRVEFVVRVYHVLLLTAIVLFLVWASGN